MNKERKLVLSLDESNCKMKFTWRSVVFVIFTSQTDKMSGNIGKTFMELIQKMPKF